MKNSNLTFQFWEIVLEFEIIALIFIRAHHSNNFNLFVESLEALVPWFFALDHTNYARWIPIHIRDMKLLPKAVKEDFRKFWVLSKTCNKFSCMLIDKAHEQNNKLVKGTGGAVGLTENPVAFKRWMVAGPEQARLLTEFETQFQEVEDSKGLHHEQGLSSQELFKKHATNLFEAMSSMRNPFEDDCPELLAMDSRNYATEAVVATVRGIKTLGLTQYQAYVANVIVAKTTSLHAPIKRNSLQLFKRQSPKFPTKSEQQVSSLKMIATFLVTCILLANIVMVT